MLVKIGTYDICNGSLAGGVAVSDLRFKIDRLYDFVVPVGDADCALLDRVNSSLELTFVVKRTFPSKELAERFIVQLDSLLPVTGNVVITTSEPGSETRLIQNATLTQHELLEENGATTFHQYTINGGSVQAANLVLGAASISSDAYLLKDLGASYSELWVRLGISFDAAALSWWNLNTASGSFLVLMAGDLSYRSSLYIGSHHWKVFREGAGNTEGGTPHANSWKTFDLYFKASDVSQLYIDGVLTIETPAGSANTVESIKVGMVDGDLDAANRAFSRNVKVGTTQGGSDIFADDFASGNLSLWTSVNGAAGLVADPF